MEYRLLWAWDSWLCDPFDGDSYVREYRDLIDFMAETGYNGLILWGFISADHGGEASAREIAEYGVRKGVRILPGVGAGGYGGFALAPGHPFHLETFLAAHRELRAIVRANNRPADGHLCLYQKEALDWIRDGAAWLASAFPIGGVNIETNEDSLIDICDHAAEATRREPNRLRYPASFCDLALAVPVIHQAVRQHRPDAWITYATYSPMWWNRMEDGSILSAIPGDAIAQWNTEWEINTEVPPPVSRNISLVHAGGWSYHLAAFPPIYGFTQYRCFYPDLEGVRRFIANQHAMGLDGFALGNAGSAAMPDNEINYLAALAFARDPALTVEGFAAATLPRLYGSEAADGVLTILLAQTGLHERLTRVWRPWAERLWEPRPGSGPLPEAATEDIAAVVEQLARVGDALAAASDEGRRRLTVIEQVLTEYQVIAEASRDPRIRGVAGRGEAERETLVTALAEQGLPRDLYTKPAMPRG